jgi:pre-rRNA-processing protein TSR3
MRSSASTPSRRSAGIRLGIVLVGNDHPRVCTGRRLIRQGLALAVPPPQDGGDRGVLLDPYAPRALSLPDRARARRAGLVAVDCSWNRLSTERSRQLAPEPPLTDRGHRRLPMLIATNPQHFGRVGELNTAEALAAALWVLGDPDRARQLLNGFAGGPTFFEVNRERLDRYAGAGSSEAIVEQERASFGRRGPPD